MGSKDYYSRDGYDLQYDRSLPARLIWPRGSVEDQPNDEDIIEITDIENALGSLIRKRNTLLNEESRKLKKILDEALFLFERLKALHPASILNTSPDVFLKKDFRHRRDAFNERNVLQKRKMEAILHRDRLGAKLKAFLAAKVQIFKGVKGGDQDTLIYRIQVNPLTHASSLKKPRSSNKPSACQWHDLGYRCSGWNYFSELTNEAILNHMNGVEVSTPMISVQESPARLMVFLKKTIMNSDEDATLVEVFSLRMLQHIGVLLVRSTDLCQDRGIPTTYDKKEGYAQYVTNTHWVILHWVPEEAIVATMTVNEFLALARDRGVIDDITKRNVLDTSYSIRFNPQDFAKAPLACSPHSVRTSDAVSKLAESASNLGLSPRNSQKGSYGMPLASGAPLQPTEQGKSPATTPKTAPISVPSCPNNEAARNPQSSIQPPPRETSSPTPISTARLQSTESPEAKASSSMPVATVKSNSLPISNSLSQPIEPSSCAELSFKPTPAEPFRSPIQSSGPTRSPDFSFNPPTKEPFVLSPLFISNQPFVSETTLFEATETSDTSAKPPPTKIASDPPSAPFQPPSTSSTSPSANPPTTPFPAPSTPPPQSTRLFNSDSSSYNSGFSYRPPIFGVPSTIPPVHSNVKSPFTVGLFGTSKDWPSSQPSFGSGNNIAGHSVLGRPGGLFNLGTAGTSSDIPSSWNFSTGGGTDGKNAEIREGCKQQ